MLWQSWDFFFCQPELMYFCFPKVASSSGASATALGGVGQPAAVRNLSRLQSCHPLPCVPWESLQHVRQLSTHPRRSKTAGVPLCSIPSSRSPPHSPDTSPTGIMGQHIQKPNSRVTWRQKGRSETLFLLPSRSQRRTRVIFDLTNKLLVKRWVRKTEICSAPSTSR